MVVIVTDTSPSGAVDSGFLHLHLYQQCDAVLLLGGMGVQECGRPGHRNTTSHEWQHKRCLCSLCKWHFRFFWCKLAAVEIPVHVLSSKRVVDERINGCVPNTALFQRLLPQF